MPSKNNKSRILLYPGFIIHRSFELYRKFDNADALIIERQTVHISDDSGRIAMLEKRTIGTDESEEELVRYIYSNHLQSSALELDSGGDIISYEEYHPYGTTSYQAMNALIKATAKRYRYTGKERDEESGLYYHGARYYIPWLCRWSASDPLESKYAGMSPYNYSFNNPVMWNDLSGASPGDETVIVKNGQGVWDIAKDQLGGKASNRQVNDLTENIKIWNGLNKDGSIDPGQLLFVQDPKTLVGKIKQGRNYYDEEGRLILNTHKNEPIQFFVLDVKDGKAGWKQGLSYQSLFGDENKSEPAKYTKLVSVPTFIESIPDMANNSLYLGIGNPNLTRLNLWMNSGELGEFDYKYKGQIAPSKIKGDYGGAISLGDGLIINAHEAGMFVWGYAASRAYGGGKWSSYKQLADDNKKMHKQIDGNDDEWGEVYAWTFGFMYQRHNNTFSDSLMKDVDTAMNLYYNNANYKSIHYKYNAKSDRPTQTIWRKIVQATIVTF